MFHSLRRIVPDVISFARAFIRIDAFNCMAQNRKKERDIVAGKYDHSDHVLSEGLLDITDREKREFRYSY